MSDHLIAAGAVQGAHAREVRRDDVVDQPVHPSRCTESGRPVTCTEIERQLELLPAVGSWRSISHPRFACTDSAVTRQSREAGVRLRRRRTGRGSTPCTPCAGGCPRQPRQAHPPLGRILKPIPNGPPVLASWLRHKPAACGRRAGSALLSTLGFDARRDPRRVRQLTGPIDTHAATLVRPTAPITGGPSMLTYVPCRSSARSEAPRRPGGPLVEPVGHLWRIWWTAPPTPRRSAASSSTTT
jgi:hypothetical protein